MTTLPVIKITKEEKRILDIVRALKKLQGATVKLVGANFYCEHAELLEFSKHLRKIIKDINTMSQHLHNVYKSSPIMYNEAQKLYNTIETVIGENNVQ